MPESTENSQNEEQKAPETTDTNEENLDDLGYEIPKDEETSEEPKEGETKPSEEPEKEEEAETIEGPSTGYEEEVPPEPEEESEEESKPDDKSDEKELKLNLEGLNEDESKLLRKFAKDNGLSKQQAQAFIDREKELIAATEQATEKAQADAKKAIARRRHEWHQELKNDPDFGGEKFASNIKKTEKVVAEFFPNMKKELTKRGNMLPPYIMKDLAKLAKTLYETKPLVRGDAIVPPKPEETEDNDPLAFYE